MEYFGISHEDCPTFALYDLEAMSKYKPATAQADMSAMFDNEKENFWRTQLVKVPILYMLISNNP